MDYLVSGVFGLIAGALLFGVTYQTVFPPLATPGNLGNVTLPSLMNVNPFLLVGVFTVFTLLLFYFLERGLIRKDKLAD